MNNMKTISSAVLASGDKQVQIPDHVLPLLADVLISSPDSTAAVRGVGDVHALCAGLPEAASLEMVFTEFSGDGEPTGNEGLAVMSAKSILARVTIIEKEIAPLISKLSAIAATCPVAEWPVTVGGKRGRKRLNRDLTPIA
jgi:hypothetical protein